jgi:hypothetical protein
MRLKSHSACGNRNLRVVEINLVRVGIIFVLFESTLRVEITLVSVIFTCIRVNFTIVCVESRAQHTLRVKSHSACGNLTMHAETKLVRVEFTLVRVGSTLYV